MNILSQFNPGNKIFLIYGQEWVFPYKVWNLLELEHTIIVCFSWEELERSPPEGIYRGCNIWCYDKATRGVKWVVEEPPIAYNQYGIIWNRNNAPNMPKDWPKIDRDECYMNVWYSKYDDSIAADTSGARRFQIDPENGKVTLIATGIR
jgi:hypothetical protein